jgi:hypothetical protein
MTVDIDAERGERVANLFHQAEVGDGIAHQAADEEFERQIVDALGAGRVNLAGRFHPVVDDTVADHEDGGGQPVVRLGDLGILTNAIGQALDDFFCEYFRLRTARCGRGDGGLRNGGHRQSSPILVLFQYVIRTSIDLLTHYRCSLCTVTTQLQQGKISKRKNRRR